MKTLPCYNCKSRKGLLYIKDFANYYMVKCEHCMIQNEDGYLVHPLEGGNSMDEAIENWNKRHET